MRGPIGSGRAAVRAREARRERAEAAEPDVDADLRDRVIRGPQQGRRTLEPAREQVLVRRRAERAPELAAEVRRRQLRGAGERRNVERIAVARVDEILRSQQVTGGSLDAHHASIAERIHSNVR